MIKKSTRILFEMFAFTVAAILVLAGLFIWTLSQEAVNISFVNPYLTQSLNTISPHFSVTIKNTTVAWDGFGKPLTFLAHDVRILNRAGGEITSTRELGISLSLRKLVTGQVMPTEIKLFEPELVATHLADGTFNLNFQIEETQNTDEPEENLMDIIREELKKPMSDDRPIGLLRKLSMTGARILYQDKVYGFTIQSPQTDIQLNRDDNGLEGLATIKLALPHGSETLRGGFFYDRTLDNFQVSASLLNIHPDKIVTIAPEKLAFLSEVRVPLSINIQSGLDADFIPSYLDATLTAKEGTMNFNNLFTTPLPVQSFVTILHYEQDKGLIQLEKCGVLLGNNAALNASGIITLHENTDISLQADASLSNMPADDLAHYWPESVAPNPREWVTTHISAGIVLKADAVVNLTIPQSDFTKLSADTVKGEIIVNKATVDYLPPMPRVTDVDATAAFSDTDFTIQLSNGRIGDINLGNGDITIDGFDKDTQTIDIAFNASGPFADIMQLIDNEPLGFASKMNMEPSSFSGNGDADVTLTFPLLNDLLMDDVKVTVKGTVSDAVAKEIVLKKTLTSPELTLFVDNKHLKMDGTGEFADLPASFSWTEQFDSSVIPLRTIDVQTAFPIQNLKNLDITFLQPYTTGLVEAHVSFVSENEQKSLLSVDADLTQTGIAFEPLSYTKAQGVKAAVHFALPLTDYELSTVDGLAYSEGKTVLNGSVNLNKDGGFQSMSLPKLQVGRNDVSAFIEGDNTLQSPLKIHLKGAVLDANPFLSSADNKDKTPQAKDDTDKTNLMLSFDVQKLFMDENGFWTNAKGVAYLKDSEKERLEIDARAGTGDIYLRFVPDGKGGYDLRFEATDSGGMIDGLGLKFANVKNGKMVIDGHAGASNPYLLSGSFNATDFNVSDAPLLARLINAFSLTGVLDLLNNEGLRFKAAHGEFSHHGDNLTLSNGAAHGDSIGFGFDGTINLDTQYININGTIIPAYRINQLMGNIPLVGNIFTGTGGEGLLAAKFSIIGDKENADVSVNPLSALTPGILRSIFFDTEEKK